jgi:hypothetical protein
MDTLSTSNVDPLSLLSKNMIVKSFESNNVTFIEAQYWGKLKNASEHLILEI